MNRFMWLGLCLAGLLTGCGEGHPTSPAVTSTADSQPPAAPPRIALVMKTLTNPFFVEMERGARSAQRELGVELLVQTAAQETSIEQQIQIVNRNIHDGVAAIVIAPGDSLELIPVLKKAQDAGIRVVNIDNRLDPELSAKLGLEAVPFISVDNEEAAYRSAGYVSGSISTPTQAVILEGIRGAANAEARKRGALRAFGENPAIEVVAMETAHWKIDEGYTVTQELFTRHPDIGLIFAANDMMALGAIQYLQDTGREGVRVAGFDALAEAGQAIREGRLVVTIDQQPARQGYLGVQYAVRSLAGESLPEETMVEARVVSRESL